MEDGHFIKTIFDINKKGQANLKDNNRFHSETLKRECPIVFVIKTWTNSHVSQVGKILLTKTFSNRTDFVTGLVFNQINKNFHFRETFSQSSFTIFIEKFKILKVQLIKCKTYRVTSSQ